MTGLPPVLVTVKRRAAVPRPRSSLVVERASAPGAGGALPYLSLNELMKLQTKPAVNTGMPPNNSDATSGTQGASQ